MSTDELVNFSSSEHTDTKEEDSNNSNLALNSEDIKIDEIADCAIETIQSILNYFNLGNITIDEYEGEEGELILDINGDNMSVLIGRHGATLDSLQVVVSSIIHSKIKFKLPVIIDVEGYKSRQKEKLESLAHSTANKVIKFKTEVKMRPMKPYERRIIHMALCDDERVETISEGEGKTRHVIVYPVLND